MKCAFARKLPEKQRINGQKERSNGRGRDGYLLAERAEEHADGGRKKTLPLPFVIGILWSVGGAWSRTHNQFRKKKNFAFQKAIDDDKAINDVRIM